MSNLAGLLDALKEYRRIFADKLEGDLTHDDVRHLADTHTAILAVEAVIAEPEPVKTGPRVTFDKDGWPI